jgi:hypothetical protein
MKKPLTPARVKRSKFRPRNRPGPAGGYIALVVFVAKPLCLCGIAAVKVPASLSRGEISMGTLSWIKSTENEWLSLDRVNLDPVTTTGVYIIWHGGPTPRTVRVGQGDIKARLTALTALIPQSAPIVLMGDCGSHGPTYHGMSWMALNGIFPLSFSRSLGTASLMRPRLQ